MDLKFLSACEVQGPHPLRCAKCTQVHKIYSALWYLTNLRSKIYFKPLYLYLYIYKIKLVVGNLVKETTKKAQLFLSGLFENIKFTNIDSKPSTRVHFFIFCKWGWFCNSLLDYPYDGKKRLLFRR